MFASRNASSSESAAGEGAGTCAFVAAAQTSAKSTARGIALGRASFSILNPQWAKYTRANLNRRLIERGELMARLEDIAFTATCVQQFVRMFVVDLFSQAVHVDLDGVGKRIESVVPDMGRDLGARNELARAAREILEQRVFFRR